MLQYSVSGMIAAMKEVGRRFEEGDYFVPEMLNAARAMQGGLALLKPYLMSSDVKSADASRAVSLAQSLLQEV